MATDIISVDPLLGVVLFRVDNREIAVKEDEGRFDVFSPGPRPVVGKDIAAMVCRMAGNALAEARRKGQLPLFGNAEEEEAYP